MTRELGDRKNCSNLNVSSPIQSDALLYDLCYARLLLYFSVGSYRVADKLGELRLLRSDGAQSGSVSRGSRGRGGRRTAHHRLGVLKMEQANGLDS